MAVVATIFSAEATLHPRAASVINPVHTQRRPSGEEPFENASCSCMDETTLFVKLREQLNYPDVVPDFQPSPQFVIIHILILPARAWKSLSCWVGSACPTEVTDRTSGPIHCPLPLRPAIYGGTAKTRLSLFLISVFSPVHGAYTPGFSPRSATCLRTTTARFSCISHGTRS